MKPNPKFKKHQKVYVPDLQIHDHSCIAEDKDSAFWGRHEQHPVGMAIKITSTTFYSPIKMWCYKLLFGRRSCWYQERYLVDAENLQLPMFEEVLNDHD